MNFLGSQTTIIVIGVLVLVVIIFVIVSTITRRKTEKKEKKQRAKIVKNELKRYIAEHEKIKNIRIEFDKIFQRKGEAYKYRDVFDVIVKIFDPKSNQFIEEKAYEIEGISKKIDKKNFKTEWQVNGSSNLDDTKRKIAIAEKSVKLTKEERKNMRQVTRNESIEFKKKEREEYLKMKEEHKNQKKSATSKMNKHTIDPMIKKSTIKYVPTRNK